MKCKNCHRDNESGSDVCAVCGASLDLIPPPPDSASGPGHAQEGGSVAEAIIPYRNPLALSAYYCGVFSLIPCLSLILGPVALILGIVGLKEAKKHPEKKGKAHAWVGIILGGLTFLFSLGIIILSVLMSNQ